MTDTLLCFKLENLQQHFCNLLSPKVKVTLLKENSAQSKRYKRASVQFDLMEKIEKELKYWVDGWIMKKKGWRLLHSIGWKKSDGRRFVWSSVLIYLVWSWYWNSLTNDSNDLSSDFVWWQGVPKLYRNRKGGTWVPITHSVINSFINLDRISFNLSKFTDKIRNKFLLLVKKVNFLVA